MEDQADMKNQVGIHENLVHDFMLALMLEYRKHTEKCQVKRQIYIEKVLGKDSRHGIS